MVPRGQDTQNNGGEKRGKEPRAKIQCPAHGCQRRKKPDTTKAREPKPRGAADHCGRAPAWAAIACRARPGRHLAKAAPGAEESDIKKNSPPHHNKKSHAGGGRARRDKEKREERQLGVTLVPNLPSRWRGQSSGRMPLVENRGPCLGRHPRGGPQARGRQGTAPRDDDGGEGEGEGGKPREEEGGGEEGGRERSPAPQGVGPPGGGL